MAKIDPNLDIVDDLYKNDGESTGIYLPGIDDEDDDNNPAPHKKEKSLMASSYPIMDELLEWFEDEVAYFKSTASIIVDDKMDDHQIARQVMVNKLVVDRLESKCNELELKFNQYKARDEDDE